MNLHDGYLLMVSTIEPRKNHEALLDAWEMLRIHKKSSAKLVLVGNIGWNSEAIIERLRPWILSGDLCLLNNVPADELRVLYRNADLTICPSVAEGFDYSGIESMCSGGVVLASDIAVHREIYAEAAEYYSTYDCRGLMLKIKALLSDNQATASRRAELQEYGRIISMKYSSESILPKWQILLNTIATNSDSA